VRWPDGRESLTAAAPVQDPALLQRLQDLFREKYGAETWRAYFEGRNAALEVDLQRKPIRLTAVDRIRREFDAAAVGYDSGLVRRPIERYLKERVSGLALDALRGRDPILEVGPGTGYHTLRLLAAGHHVVAVDISERMLEELRAAASRSDLAGQLVTRTARLGELGSALADLPAGHFGGAFSAFGPFNLEPEVDAAVPSLSRLLRPGGRLAFTSLNRPGLSPLLWDLLLARPRAAGYRFGETVPPGGLRYPLELHLRSPRDWDRSLAPGFVRESAVPVSVLAPPFESDRIVRFLGSRGAERARRSDAFFSLRSSARVAAEWVWLTYRRTDRSAPG
jgi:SAM-dependent methyltransferase